ncbi:transcriptional regulator, TetR family [Nocardia amikacinitolerans]|uniref:Transcriptional regulator, TetR family n=1 Tax=Nocardia amikacinitolerans TaxID=756689 RepID=A0A285LIF3_9NOCA|nr:TetR/AcrR family transcriptional regulator [Nocardia amikacinitolerans]SNY84662.1 transcriptional regulator, TetR family [Nocardia amikacinitolerans]
MTDSADRPRRTQQQRRAATVAKLIEATIAAIGEVGYQRATVQEICGRAGLSVGAMFRQFDSRLDLVVRTADEIVTRQLAGFRAVMEQLGAQENPLEVALRFLRDAQSSTITHALREIYLAARSDAELRDRIAPTVEQYYAEIVAEVERTEVLRDFPARIREPLFFLTLHLFSGQAIVRGVIPNPERDDAVFTLVLDMLTTYAESLARQRK